MGKNKDKGLPDVDIASAGRYTFRTLIKELQDNTNLKPSFYTRFNRGAAVSEARSLFDDGVAKNAKPGKKTSKAPKDKTNGKGDDGDVLSHINASLANLDMNSVGAADVVVSAYRLIDKLDDNIQVMFAQKQIKKLLDLTHKEADQFIKAARRREGDGLTDVEIDLIEKVTAKYRTDNQIIFTMGQYYLYDTKQKVWRAFTKDAITAELLVVVREFATGGQNFDINNVVNESATRLKNENNGEVLFQAFDLGKKFRQSNIAMMDTLNSATTDIFTNVENATTISGDCYLYLNNALMCINLAKHMGHIPRGNVYNQYTKDEFSIDAVLFNKMDREANDIKGLYTLDYERDGLYYRSHYKANWMGNKALKRAVHTRKCKHFVRFLMAISSHLSGYDRSCFLTAYLDMLAYLIQPIKRHNCFFYVYGLGENGKSFGIKIIERIAGSDKVTFRELENANENPRFFAANLADAYAVVEDDLQHFKPELGGLMKKFSNGNQVVAAELKNDNMLKTYLLKCSMVLLSNKRININDTTKGMSRRLYPFTFGTDISTLFDQDRNGVPLLRKELDVVFNLLRYRMPRVIKNGVQQNHLMQGDIQQITRGSSLDRMMRCVVRHKKKDVKLTDVYSHISHELGTLYGTSSRQVDRVTLEGIRDKATQLGFTVDDINGVIKQARIKKLKKDG